MLELIVYVSHMYTRIKEETISDADIQKRFIFNLCEGSHKPFGNEPSNGLGQIKYNV